MDVRRAVSRSLITIGILTLFALAPDVALAAPGDNIAAGQHYKLEPPPNYIQSVTVGDTEPPWDLTDGLVYDADYLAPGSVVWGAPAARISLDVTSLDCSSNVNNCKPIQEIFFQLRHQVRAPIFCPQRVLFEVSDDSYTNPAAVFHPVKDLVRTDNCTNFSDMCKTPTPADHHGGPDTGPYNFIITTGPNFATRGRGVRITVFPPQGSSFVSIDELEVREGTDVNQTNYLPQGSLDSFGSIWRVFNSDPWAAVNGQSLPPAGASDAGTVSMTLAGDETGAAALMITNPYSTDLTINPSVSTLLNGGQSLPGSTITTRYAVDAGTDLLDTRADALALATGSKVKKRAVTHVFMEATVPAGTAAGTYTGTLTLTCALCPTGNTQATVGLSLTVRPFTLAPRKNLSTKFFDWSYSIPNNDPYIPGGYASQRRTTRGAYGENADLTYLVNRPGWVGSQQQPPNFTYLDDEIANTKSSGTGVNFYSGMYILWLNLSDANVLHFDGNRCYRDAQDHLNSQWTSAMQTWVTDIKNHLSQTHGLTTAQYAFYLIDEPAITFSIQPTLPGYGTTCPDPADQPFRLINDAAAAIHGADSSFRIFENPTEYYDSSASTGLASMVGSVNIWSPPYGNYFFEDYCENLDSDLGSHLQSERDFYVQRKAAGDTVYTYNPGPQPGSSASPPHRSARIPAWKNFSANFDSAGNLVPGIKGLGYWALYAVRNDPLGGLTSLWTAQDGATGPGSGVDWGTIYLTSTDDAKTPANVPTTEPIIPSRRVAAFRQGVEDTRYMQTLLDLINQWSATMDVSYWRTSLKTAIDNVLASPDDPTVAEASRSTIASLIYDLQNPQVFTSITGQDGWILEQSRNSETGGSLNSSTTTTMGLTLGDTNSKQQYRSVVSFDTSPIPDTAVIKTATLTLYRDVGSINTGVGQNPFATLGSILGDIGAPLIGGSALELTDWQQAIGVSQGVVTLVDQHPGQNVTSSATGAVSPAVLTNVSKTATTQFRIRFTTEDDGDNQTDTLGYYAGEGPSGKKPTLTVLVHY